MRGSGERLERLCGAGSCHHPTDPPSRRLGLAHLVSLAPHVGCGQCHPRRCLCRVALEPGCSSHASTAVVGFVHKRSSQRPSLAGPHPDVWVRRDNLGRSVACVDIDSRQRTVDHVAA